MREPAAGWLVTLPVLDPASGVSVRDTYAVWVDDSAQALAAVRYLKFMFAPDETGGGRRELPEVLEGLSEDRLLALGLKPGGLMRLMSTSAMAPRIRRAKAPRAG